jgi:WD40 repeat protein/tRNA A-37 threonylcarbamoyl transferase component Bud32
MAKPDELNAQPDCEAQRASSAAESTASGLDSLSDPLPPQLPSARVPPLKLDALSTLHYPAALAADLKPTLPDYEILGELGRGGMGVVYKARDIRLNRLVALKMILAKAGSSALERFRKEALAVARLRHPNIIQIYGVGYSNEQPYIALELAEGGSLAARLRGEPLPPAQAAQLVEVLANAMHAVHRQGVIHRDLKPANVLLSQDGMPKISDFGLAKQINAEGVNATHSGAILGTPSYMAPEQARGDIGNISPATDVYALGVLLYELLTGSPPFRAESVLQTLQLVCDNEAVPPRQLQPHCPRDLETICLKCLQKNPSRRYESAEALADDLRRFIEGKPIHARPVGIAERLAKWAARYPAVAALMTLSFLIAVVGVALVLWQWQRAESSLGRLERANRDERAHRRHAEDALTEARTQLYLTRIGQVDREWRAGNIVRADQLLEQCLPVELRAWEWYYLKRLCHTELLTLSGHDWALRGAGYVAGGKLVSAGLDGTIKFWDLDTGQATHTFRAHNGILQNIAISADGKQFATCSGTPPEPVRPGELKVWDAVTGEEVRSFAGHSREVISVAFSPDGKRLASGSEDNLAKVWLIETGKELHSFEGHTASVSCVAFSPDGKYLATGSRDTTIRIWDLDTGKETQCLRGHQQLIFGIAFHPDGQHLASCSTDQTVRLWDLGKGTDRVLAGHKASVNCVAFSPDGHLLASVSHDRTLKLWDSASGQEVLSLKGHDTYVQSVAFSPDGKQLATGSGDQTVKLWAVDTYQEVRTLGFQTGMVNSVDVSRDGKRFVSASSRELDAQGVPQPGAVKVWDAATGQELFSPTGHTAEVSSVCFSPDGTRLASAGGGFHRDGKQLRRWSEVNIWDADNGKLIFALAGHMDRATAVTFSPDGTRLATASWDKTVRVWNALTGVQERELHGHTDTVWSVAFSPDGKQLASSARDKTVRLWDLTTGQEAFVLQGHTKSVSCVAYSGDGETLASGSFDQTVKLWNPKTGQEITTLRGHTEGVMGLAFSPDNRRLASTELLGTLKVWDVASGQEALSLGGASGKVVFTRDGWQIVGAGANGTIKVWDARLQKKR